MVNIEFMAGAWSFTRTITNNLDARSSGNVAGTAFFLQIPNQTNKLQYTEQGRFVMVAGLTINISNEYFYIFDLYNNTIAKYASQAGVIGAMLYILQNNTIAEHLCNKDRYLASYEFYPENFNEFVMTYQVSGPQKNYSSCTKYIKLLEH